MHGTVSLPIIDGVSNRYSFRVDSYETLGGDKENPEYEDIASGQTHRARLNATLRPNEAGPLGYGRGGLSAGRARGGFIGRERGRGGRSHSRPMSAFHLADSSTYFADLLGKIILSSATLLQNYELCQMFLCNLLPALVAEVDILPVMAVSWQISTQRFALLRILHRHHCPDTGYRLAVQAKGS